MYALVALPRLDVAGTTALSQWFIENECTQTLVAVAKGVQSTNETYILESV